MIIGIVLVVSLFVIAKNVAAASDPVRNNEKIVTIYDQGQEQTIITRARTVEEAIKQAEIEVGGLDTVEPALDKQLIAQNYRINIYRARPVVLVDGSNRIKLITAAQSPKQIFSDAGLKLYDEDITQFSRTDDVVSDGGAGLKLAVKRATPFMFTLYGKQFEARTQAKTVGEMLKEKGVVLGAADGSSVPMETPLTSGLDVRVWRNGKQTVTIEEAIAKPTEQVKDMDQSISYRQVKTPGADGKKQVTYEIEMRDGKEISRKMIASVTTLEPVKEIVVVGVKSTSPTENEAITWNFLIQHGYSRNQAAGIMGNLQQEHGFRTDGDGIVQWTGGRKANLMSRPDPYSIYTQLNFMLEELNGSYASANAAIKASSTVEQATVIFQNRYEGCGVCMETRRIQFAYEILGRH